MVVLEGEKTLIAGKKQRSFKELGPLVALMSLAIFTTVLNPRFLTAFNLQALGRQIAIFGLLAIGETFVIISGGGAIDLSPGSVVALTGVMVAWLMTHGVSVWISLFLILLFSLGIGAWHGVFVTKLKVPAFIITLGTLTIARGMAAVITRGWPVINLPGSFLKIGQADFLKIPVPVWILIGVTLIADFFLRKTVYGKHLRASGGNEIAARFSGVNVDAVRTIAFMVSGFLAGLVGVIVAARLSQGQPGVGSMYELYAIASTVIGGTSLTGGEGSVLGAIIGASIISLLWNALVLLNVSTYWHNVVIGIVIVVAVTLDIVRRRFVSK
ncbi:ABC transporter permease [Pseudothermotoga elfii]|uniref:ABC transporter permease n=1 Tax=Pseudothermotoga elfii TaxID=38322 RepID=UPI0004080E16|nr:ABC transporter permease [Pseudothermotoga elfii]